MIISMSPKQQSRISKLMALELCTIYKESVQSQPSPRVTSSRTQELSTELGTADSPWDLSGHLAPRQDTVALGIHKSRQGREW